MFYIVYPLLYLLSLLPFFILYGLSDILAFFLCHVFRYRRDVILDNLHIAFPEKTHKERKQIAREFYLNFTDSFVETLKLFSMSKDQLKKRTSSDYNLVNEMLKKGQSVNLLCGHQFNWEYGNLAYSAAIDIPFVALYLPVKNAVVDRIMYKVRSKFGATMVTPEEFSRKIHNVFKSQYALVLVADQSPALPTSGYWINFFNRPTVFVFGPEKSAIRNKVAVVSFGFKKIKRGHYRFDPVVLTENAANIPERGHITKLYTKQLENAIRNDPANYLWSHRRFKFEWQPEFGKIIE